MFSVPTTMTTVLLIILSSLQIYVYNKAKKALDNEDRDTFVDDPIVGLVRGLSVAILVIAILLLCYSFYNKNKEQIRSYLMRNKKAT